MRCTLTILLTIMMTMPFMALAFGGSATSVIADRLMHVVSEDLTSAQPYIALGSEAKVTSMARELNAINVGM